MAKKPYPEPVSNPDFATIENEVLKYWEDSSAFEASVEARSAEKDGEQNEYVFYDGPPFANGLPHYGHLLTGFVKDAYARYHTMRGQRVERRFGWDCHGLPAEMGAEKELGISGRAAITDFGIGKFNKHCQLSVMKYAREWEDYVTRQGRWVDFKNDYKTMQTPYMESVLWAFKQLYEKGLIFESHRVMPYSWAAETPLSNFETKLDNSYRERTDKAVTVKFKLKQPPKGTPEAGGYYLLAWTTTPWTLPSNLALAASEKLNYIATYHVEDGMCWIEDISSTRKRFSDWGKAFQPAIQKLDTLEYNQILDLEVDDIHEGKLLAVKLESSNIIGLDYEPLFPYFADQPNAFKVLDGTSFIEEGEGTGIVHMAPGFGEDDQRICAEAGIDVVVPVDERGRYTEAIFDLPNCTLEKDRIETERLYLRPFREDEYALFKKVEGHPELTKNMAMGALTPEQLQVEFQRLLVDQKTLGYTQWAIFRKEDSAFLGRAGLDHRDFGQPIVSDGSRIELRYGLIPDYWGNGYATEVSLAWMHWAAIHTQAKEVEAGTNDWNTASQKILERCRFSHVGNVPFTDKAGVQKDINALCCGIG